MTVDLAIGSLRGMDYPHTDLFSEALSAAKNHLDSSIFKTPGSKMCV